MEKLKLPTTFAEPGSQVSRPARGMVIQDRKPNGPLPKISNPLTDVEIPRNVWSSWKEFGKPHQLRRPLTANERLALESRRDELAPTLAPFSGKAEIDRVSIALADMLTSFRSMRQTGNEAYAVVESARRSLQDFPVWAIEKTCRSIQMNGVWREGKFDRQWPPNDSEIVDEVRKELKVYGDQHRSAVALLNATVE